MRALLKIAMTLPTHIFNSYSYQQCSFFSFLSFFFWFLFLQRHEKWTEMSLLNYFRRKYLFMLFVTPVRIVSYFCLIDALMN